MFIFFVPHPQRHLGATPLMNAIQTYNLPDINVWLSPATVNETDAVSCGLAGPKCFVASLPEECAQCTGARCVQHTIVRLLALVHHSLVSSSLVLVVFAWPIARFSKSWATCDPFCIPRFVLLGLLVRAKVDPRFDCH